MAIDTIIKKGVSTIFKILNPLVHPANYVIESDDGFGVTTSTTYPVSVIITTFTEDDMLKHVRLSNLIQAQDLQGLVKASDIPVELTSGDYLTITDTSIFNGRHNVVGWDTDPVNALYILILRRI